ncbi:MAG: 16S rRNA (cytidine(1402)-2'-O)-methyltransferase [Actinobacteria bacterium]|nr:16S rRNA (cytidine(1402)-2'-O)-methyltransferase [Actinomycetota bacterium]
MDKDTEGHNVAVGELILAGVPLGNIGDASERLKTAISSADVVLAEDSRRFARLCKDLGIECRAEVLSFFEGNETSRLDEIATHLASGLQVLLVSDAGMPSVSDPGYRAVRMAIDKGFRVSVIPGPSAPLAALAISGLPSDSFAFDGFVPRGSGARDQFFEDRATETRTLIVFEAPHRISESLESMIKSFGENRQAVICRELTKNYEEVVRGDLSELLTWSESKEMLGEFTIVIAPYDPSEQAINYQDVVDAVSRYESAGITRKEAIASAAKELRIRKRKVFDIMVEQK